ncbi:hypothetical protein ACEYYB_11560 [Paracoccus sp. p4-l81]|uniref:hypothetical protein n=1 Tax=unclassified Paracoccus (in: a-proteobacteria) TaxID=2688777 RepID=UPI0035B846E1
MTTFPRKDDGKGWAWGLTGDAPATVWERFSPAYEAQAKDVLDALTRLFGRADLDFAGGQDGEAALALAPSGRLLLLLHLENPETAEHLAKARAEGRLDDALRAHRAADQAEAIRHGYQPDDEDRAADARAGITDADLAAASQAHDATPEADDDGISFPREDDGLGWAWGLSGDTPTEVWERFSPAYEAQAEAVLAEISAQGWLAVLDWAGEQDGEAAIGLTDDDHIALILHLEDPVEARLIESAIRDGSLPALVRQAAQG